MTIRIPGMQRVQALGGISRSALCCHSNETRAPIANPPNSAQLQGTVTNIHFASATHHAECTNDVFCNTTDRLFVTVDSPYMAINLLIFQREIHTLAL